jgi:hypothetical protein
MRSTIRAVTGAALTPAVMRPPVSGVPCGSNSRTRVIYCGACMGKAPRNEEITAFSR